MKQPNDIGRSGGYILPRPAHASNAPVQPMISRLDSFIRTGVLLSRKSTTADISIVYMKKSGTVAAPVALGVAGGVLGFIGGFYVGYLMDNEPMAAIFSVGSAAGGATGGAMLGRQAVRITVTIAVTTPTK